MFSVGHFIYLFSVYLKQSPQSQPIPGTLQIIKSAFLDCFSTSTGHGLPQMAKPDNLFLRVLWALFFIVALVGNSVFIYQAVDQYLQFGVITTTKINRVTQMTMPAITFCSEGNTKDMILECQYGTVPGKDCNWKNLTLYARGSTQVNCRQLNHDMNLTGLDKAVGVGAVYGYHITLYTPPYDTDISLAVNDNSARVVEDEVREAIIPGEETDIALSKTVQSALGPPYSSCNETQEFRQITCVEDCIFRTISEICRCAYPAGCEFSNSVGLTEECKAAYNHNRSAIESICNKNCSSECNQVNFPINRIDVEFDIEQERLDEYKLEISAKFDITGMSDAEIKKKFTKLKIYFSRLETIEITQSPSMTTTNLVGNVGGLLGK